MRTGLLTYDRLWKRTLRVLVHDLDRAFIKKLLTYITTIAGPGSRGPAFAIVLHAVGYQIKSLFYKYMARSRKALQWSATIDPFHALAVATHTSITATRMGRASRLLKPSGF